MPTAEEQIAIANRDAIARGRTLVIGFGVELARELQPEAVFHQDYRRFLATRDVVDARFGAWLDTDERFDSVVVELPKATGRLRMVLAMAADVLVPGGSLALVGHNDAGIKSVRPHLRALVGEPEVVDYRAHCRVYTTVVDPSLERPSSLDAWRAEFVADVAGGPLTVRSYPGVFAHGKLDDGTRVLLEHLGFGDGARVLDVGCGSGVISAWAARAGASVTSTDIDALALAATAETVSLAGGEADVLPADVYDGVEGTFSHVVTNPPFHAGIRTTSAVGTRVIEQAPAHLDRGGELWLVANRFLDYMTPLRATFGTRFSVEHEDGRWRVYRARAYPMGRGT